MTRTIRSDRSPRARGLTLLLAGAALLVWGAGCQKAYEGPGRLSGEARGQPWTGGRGVGAGAASGGGTADAGGTDISASDAIFRADGSSLRTCLVSCDCLQGETCLGGVCLNLATPTYCCTRSGCPRGERCEELTGATNICPPRITCTDTCDCPQGLRCVASVCQKSETPLYCCTNPGCPQGSPCVDAFGQGGRCGQ